jgi:hypothetical protein
LRWIANFGLRWIEAELSMKRRVVSGLGVERWWEMCWRLFVVLGVVDELGSLRVVVGSKV